MAPANRFRHHREQREKREVTPFAGDDNGASLLVPEEIPAEWRNVEAPPNFTWVGQDELAGMGWPKSRDQVRFLVEQGIDHLITLSADKIPPHYAFPEMKWSLIPVEDFHGPAIRDIKKFLNIMDEARKLGEAVGVHCAEGRGRTGVMCACFLIYYYDLKPWDAIRIMRRQRPGSVERKVQEDTVVRFYQLLQDYGKQALEDLEEKEKEWKEMQRREKEQQSMLNCENLLPNHTASFFGPQQRAESKIQRLERMQQRMRRCRSMPKMTQEEEEAERNELNFRQHLQNFYGSGSSDRRSQPRDKERDKAGDTPGQDRSARAITPGRSLLEGLKKTPVKKSEVTEPSSTACDFTKHFKSFMAAGSTSVKRARSFSQPKDRDNNGNGRSGNISSNNVVESGNCSRPVSSSDSADSSSVSMMSTGTDDADSEFGGSLTTADDSRERSNVASTEQHLAPPAEMPPPNTASTSTITSSPAGSTSAAKRYLRRRRRSKDRSNKEAADAAAEAAASHAEEEDAKQKQKDAEVHTVTEQSFQLSYSSYRRGSVDSTCSTGTEGGKERPKPPSYTPMYVIDSSSTYSYYTRLRSRTAMAPAKVDEEEEGNSRRQQQQEQSKKHVDLTQRRAKTVDRDMCVTVTVTESLSPSPSGVFYPRQYSHTNSNDRLILPSVCENHDNSSSPSSRESSIAATLRAAAAYNPSRSRRSSVSSRSSIEDGGGGNGTSNSNFRKSRNSNSTLSLESGEDKKERKRLGLQQYRRSRTNPLDAEIDILENENRQQQQGRPKKKHHNGHRRPSRTSLDETSTTTASADDNDNRKKAVANDNDEYNNTSLVAKRRSTAAAIRRSREERAVSVFCPPTYSSSSASSSTYTSSSSRYAQSMSPTSTYLDNSNRRSPGTPSSSLSARPASSYSPFSRDNWKRTNHRYNYSRFLSTRETYV